MAPRLNVDVSADFLKLSATNQLVAVYGCVWSGSSGTVVQVGGTMHRTLGQPDQEYCSAAKPPLAVTTLGRSWSFDLLKQFGRSGTPRRAHKPSAMEKAGGFGRNW